MLKIYLIIFFFLFSSSISFSKDEYFLTLRYDKVNLRLGPSKDYPVKIFYKKKYLPVLVVDQLDNFKKIKDHENNTGWIHISQLSKKKAAITTKDNLLIFNKPTIYSKPSAVLKMGILCIVQKCKSEWCKIRVANFKGWVKKDSLWGLL